MAREELDKNMGNSIPENVKPYLNGMPTDIRLAIAEAFSAKQKLSQIELKEINWELYSEIRRIAEAIKFKDFTEKFTKFLENNWGKINWIKKVSGIKEQLNFWWNPRSLDHIIIHFTLLWEDLCFDISEKLYWEYSRLSFIYPNHITPERKEELSNSLIKILKSCLNG